LLGVRFHDSQSTDFGMLVHFDAAPLYFENDPIRRRSSSATSLKKPDGSRRPFPHQENINCDNLDLEILYLTAEGFEDSEGLPKPELPAKKVTDQIKPRLTSLHQSLKSC
jgi:hypothetical protein